MSTTSMKIALFLSKLFLAAFVGFRNASLKSGQAPVIEWQERDGRGRAVNSLRFEVPVDFAVEEVYAPE